MNLTAIHEAGFEIMNIELGHAFKSVDIIPSSMIDRHGGVSGGKPYVNLDDIEKYSEHPKPQMTKLFERIIMINLAGREAVRLFQKDPEFKCENCDALLRKRDFKKGICWKCRKPI